MKTKISFLFLSSILALTLMGCGDQGPKTTVLKLAHGLDQTHPVHKSMEKMAEILAEKSQGSVTIEIYPSEQLGTERETIEQLQLGSIAMAKSSTAIMEAFVPVMGVLSQPYIFRDEDHFWRVILGPIGKKLLKSGEGSGLFGLCFYDAGARSFYTKERRIETPEDLAGLKIRVMQSKTSIDMINALGANPTPISWGELYTSLQQGVVDGAENNVPSFSTSGHYEVCKYYILDEHTRIPDILLMSKAVWDGLSPEVQQMVQESADESALFQRKLWAEKTEEDLAMVQKSGVEIIHPDKTPFQEMVSEMHASVEDPEVRDLLKEIKEAD